MSLVDLFEGQPIGLVLHGHHLHYGVNGHGRFIWLPWPVKRAVAAAWNFVSCRLLGHETFGPVDEPGMRPIPKTCCHCGKTWPGGSR